MRVASLFAVVLSFARIAFADDLFIYPTAPGPNNNFVADLLWPVGSTQKIQWSTTISSYYIALFQQHVEASSGQQLQTIYSVSSDGSGQQSFSWVVQTYNSNLSSSPIYFLWLNPGASNSFTSHYFNITNQAASSSTTSASSNSPATSITATSTSMTPPPTSSATTPAPLNTSSSTDTVKVGLGVGLGIGIPLVLIAGIWIGLKSVQQRKSSAQSTNPGMPLSQFPDMEYPANPYHPPDESAYYANKINEAPMTSPKIHEAPTDRALIELGSGES